MRRENSPPVVLQFNQIEQDLYPSAAHRLAALHHRFLLWVLISQFLDSAPKVSLDAVVLPKGVSHKGQLSYQLSYRSVVTHSVCRCLQ